MGVLIHLVLETVAVFVAANVLSGVIVDSWMTALVVAVVLGIVNMFIKPIINILALPINLLTLGLFSIIVNGLLILLVASLVPGFQVAGILWAIIFSLVLSLINWFLHLFIPD